jgi:acyl carrier protein
LLEHSAKSLADFKVPEKIVFLAEIPKGSTGKPQRIGLAEKLGLTSLGGSMRGRAAEYRAPHTETETRLAEMWSQVLKLDRAGIDDDFFEAGGDSIPASQLVVRIRQRFGVELTVPHLFRLPTVATLAHSIDEKSSGAPACTDLPSVSRKNGVRLTAAQQRMWFLSHLEPENPVYNRAFAYRLKGPLDLLRLQQGLNTVVERHEILRTNYGEHDSAPTGIVKAARAVPISLSDLTGLSRAEQDRATMQWMHREWSIPFNLVADSVLRCSLARLDSDDHVLLMVIHHIACYASSERVILEDLARAYDCKPGSEPGPQYADHAAWQSSREAHGAGEGVSWWKRQLWGLEKRNEIRLDFARPLKSEHQQSSVPIVLSYDVAEKCRSLARECNTTIFTVLLAALDAVLHRYTAGDDIVVGTPVTVRNHPATESMIGLFVNTLALRVSAAGDPTFREFLARVREIAAGGLEHQEVPFDAVVGALRVAHRSTRPALFQVMLNYRNIEPARLSLKDIVSDPVEFNIGSSPFDLTFDIEPLNGGLRSNLY